MSYPGWKCAASLLLAGIVALGSSNFAFAQAGGAGEGTPPAPETIRSAVMNNWLDTIAIHYSRQHYPSDLNLFGPYLAALHSKADWTVNQIDGATAFFRAEAVDGSKTTGPERRASLCESSGEVSGDNLPADPGVRQSYPSIMCLDDGGILNVE